ncbi:MAG: aldehyde dehydrogenase [Niabella sp.]
MDTHIDFHSLSGMRRYFDSGATMPYTFRLKQLKALRQALMEHEKDISKALYADLRKSETEAFLTEFGLLMAELKMAIRKLAAWMRPQRVPTNLVNLPSSSHLYPYPKGVVLIISAWNYPLLLSLVPVVGAMAGGNCIVLKLSEYAPATAAVIEKICKAVFDENYIRIVQGDGSKVVPALMDAIPFDHVFYTGGGRVGQAVYEQAAKKLIPVTLELGGKSPVIVEKDAHIQVAARRIVFGKYINAGQTCVAPDYLLVHEDMQDKLITAMKDVIEKSFGTDARQSPDYSRLIHKRRFETLLAWLQQTKGKIVIGGDYHADDLYIAPTIIKDVALTEPMMQEEIFGPLLPVITFRKRAEALAIIARHPNPLAFYLFTSDTKNEKEWLGRIAFGNGCINNTIQHLANPHLPFGGVGQSGIGAYRGVHSFKVFTHVRAVMKTPIWFDPAVKYPPYANKLKWLRRLF